MGAVCVAFARGCPRSQVGAGKLFEYFERNGWALSDRFEDADLTIVTTCGFDLNSEECSLNLLSAVERRRKPGSQVIVTGCLAGISEQSLRDRFDVMVLAPTQIDRLDEIIHAQVRLGEVEDPNCLQPIISRARKPFTYRDWHNTDSKAKVFVYRALIALGARKALMALGIKKPEPSNLEPVDNVFSILIANGCLGECTYCAIRFALGRLRSKPLDKVLAEFDKGLTAGHKEFKIIAQDIGPYGYDIGTSLLELMYRLFSRKTDFRLTFLDINPDSFIRNSQDLLPTLADNSERIRLLMIPIQSGSERILSLMRRGHTAKDARECLFALRKAAPQVALASHVIVGFPGETDRDFRDTVDFLNAIQFDRIDAYSYDDRPKTEASSFPDKVPQEIKEQRLAYLRKQFKVSSW